MDLIKKIFKIFSYILYLIPGVWVAFIVSKATKRFEVSDNADDIIKNTQKINIWTIALGAFVWACIASFFVLKSKHVDEPEQMLYLGGFSIVLFVIFCYRKIKYS